VVFAFQTQLIHVFLLRLWHHSAIYGICSHWFTLWLKDVVIGHDFDRLWFALTTRTTFNLYVIACLLIVNSLMLSLIVFSRDVDQLEVTCWCDLFSDRLFDVATLHAWACFSGLLEFFAESLGRDHGSAWGQLICDCIIVDNLCLGHSYFLTRTLFGFASFGFGALYYGHLRLFCCMLWRFCNQHVWNSE